MPDLAKLGCRFSEIRQRSGLTQKQVAEYLKVDQSYISKCEKNERQFSADTLERAACLFGCCCVYLHGEADKPILEPIAMPSRKMDGQDLEGIAEISRLAINLRLMEDYLKGDKK